MTSLKANDIFFLSDMFKEAKKVHPNFPVVAALHDSVRYHFMKLYLCFLLGN